MAVIRDAEEARRAAQSIAEDVAAGRPVPPYLDQIYVDRSDVMWVGQFLEEILTEAVTRYRAGARDDATSRLVAFAEAARAAGAAAEDARRQELELERLDREVSNMAAFPDTPAHLGDKMNVLGPFGVMLPEDAQADGDSAWLTSIAAPKDLMAYYANALATDGWTVDFEPSVFTVADHTSVANCFFDRGDLEGRSLSIIIGQASDGSGRTRFMFTTIDA
jgi:hypothetical protein